MPQEIEETTPTIRKLKINIPSSVIEEEIANAYNKLRMRARIPGFRIGKAPKAILEKKFGRDIEAEVIEKVVPEFYSKAVREAQILPITYPDIDRKLELEKDEPGTSRYRPLSFTATVEIKPEIKDLNYEGIDLKEKTFSVEDREVETAIKTLQESRALLTACEGPVKDGDTAIIDCDAFIDGKELNELKSKDYPFILGSPVMPKEFSDAFADKKKGDSFEIRINFDETHTHKTIAGKEVLFKVSITEMKEKVLPQLDDEFAKGFDCSNIEELKKNVYENIYNRKKNQKTDEHKQELIEHLIRNHNFEVPSSMVKRELEFLIEETKQNAMRRGEAVKTDDELKKEYEPKARENVKCIVLLESIGKKEKIEVSEEEMNQAVNEIAEQNQLKPEELKKLYIMKDGSLNGLKNKLFTDKVLDVVLSKAVIK